MKLWKPAEASALRSSEKGARFRHSSSVSMAGCIHLNECGHVPAELDWMPGEFFDHSKLYLICSIHGALYAPDSGQCLGGPCRGNGLRPLMVREADGMIWLESER